MENDQIVYIALICTTDKLCQLHGSDYFNLMIFCPVAKHMCTEMNLDLHSSFTQIVVKVKPKKDEFKRIQDCLG